jgi:predicted DNA-binding WGR domain protein
MWYWVNDEKQRYYQADLVQDLFGDWTIIRAWGGLHAKQGNMEVVCVKNEEQGWQKLEQLKRERKRRGYALKRGLME